MPWGPEMPLVMQYLCRQCLYFFVQSYLAETSFLVYLDYIMGLRPNKNRGKIGGHSPKHCKQISNLHQVHPISIQFNTSH